jgi:hypothetical protein
MTFSPFIAFLFFTGGAFDLAKRKKPLFVENARAPPPRSQ